MQFKIVKFKEDWYIQIFEESGDSITLKVTSFAIVERLVETFKYDCEIVARIPE